MSSRPLKQRGLIVSCQALAGEPLHGGDTMVKMAVAAQQCGAVGIRANGAEDIRGIRQAVDLPIIGIIKRTIPGSDIFITPTVEEARQVLEAGADIVAMDVTDREQRLDTVREIIEFVHRSGGLVMADISTLEEGIAAEELGADYVGTTLSGYTPYSRQSESPDFRLLTQLAQLLGRAELIAEGRISSPSEAAMALALGAKCVVVGSAITRPQLIIKPYMDCINEILA